MRAGPTAHTARWKAYLRDCDSLVNFVEPMQVSGRVTRVAGLVMEASACAWRSAAPAPSRWPTASRIEAEVVGFDGDRLFLMPQSDVEGMVPGSRVFPVEALAAASRAA